MRVCVLLFSIAGFALGVFPTDYMLHAQVPSAALRGYVDGPAQDGVLQVSGRPVRLAHDSQFNCTNIPPPGLTIRDGFPVLPRGSLVDVFGRWDKKTAAYSASSICPVAVPEREVSGEAVIDAVSSSPDGEALLADGRRLVIPQTPALRGALGLPAKLDALVGQWLAYKAERQKGVLILTVAEVRSNLDSQLEVKLRDVKPLVLTPPTGGQDGRLKWGKLMPSWTLSGDAAAEARVMRVSNRLGPAWSNTSPTTGSPWIPLSFYLVKNLKVNDCASFANGIVLVPLKVYDRLADDAELAAVLGGCIAEIEERQTARFAVKDAASSEAGMAGLAGFAGAALAVGALPVVLGGDVYAAHLRQLKEEQSARVALFYLHQAGYPATAGAAAWEKLDSRHGKMEPNEMPSRRSEIFYKAAAENAPLP